MEQSTIKTLDASLTEALRVDPAKTGEAARSRREMNLPGALGDQARAPRRIAGGFAGLSEDLDRRMRDWRNMLRVLDQQRPQLEAAELQYDAAYETLAKIVPQAQDTGKALKAMIATTKAGDISEDLAGQFSRNLKALEELEAVAENLTTT
ncbi:MAG: hypothetical protein ACK4R3_11420, partial [Aliihoeflea sp.]